MSQNANNIEEILSKLDTEIEAIALEPIREATG